MIQLHKTANIPFGMTIRSSKVKYIAPGSPAEKAHVKIGDLIVAVNQKNLTSSDDIVSEILASGNSVNLTVYREGIVIFEISRAFFKLV